MAQRISNMITSAGNPVANQFLVHTDAGVYFKSYSSMIAFIPLSGKIQLDEQYWDYSTTTGKYRNMFLEENIKETRAKIKSGEYELVNLN